MKRWIKSSTSITSSNNYSDYVNFRHGRSKFGVHISYQDDPENLQFSMDVIKPYDDAEYAWAKKDSPVDVKIIKGGKIIDHVSIPEYDEDNYETPDEYVDDVLDIVALKLIEYNKAIEPRMIHN